MPGARAVTSVSGWEDGGGRRWGEEEWGGGGERRRGVEVEGRRGGGR